MIFEPVRATLAKQSPDQILYSANIGDPSTPQRENVQKNKPHLQLESVLVGGRFLIRTSAQNGEAEANFNLPRCVAVLCALSSFSMPL